MKRKQSKEREGGSNSSLSPKLKRRLRLRCCTEQQQQQQEVNEKEQSDKQKVVSLRKKLKTKEARIKELEARLEGAKAENVRLGQLVEGLEKHVNAVLVDSAQRHVSLISTLSKIKDDQISSLAEESNALAAQNIVLKAEVQRLKTPEKLGTLNLNVSSDSGSDNELNRKSVKDGDFMTLNFDDDDNNERNNCGNNYYSSNEQFVCDGGGNDGNDTNISRKEEFTELQKSYSESIETESNNNNSNENDSDSKTRIKELEEELTKSKVALIEANARAEEAQRQYTEAKGMWAKFNEDAVALENVELFDSLAILLKELSAFEKEHETDLNKSSTSELKMKIFEVCAKINRIKIVHKQIKKNPDSPFKANRTMSPAKKGGRRSTSFNIFHTPLRQKTNDDDDTNEN